MAESTRKVVIVGAGGVGKSCVTVRFVQNKFIRKYDPTIEDFYRKQIEVDSEIETLDILDTAGQEEFSALRDSYMKTGNGFILVYAVNSVSSFEDCRNFRSQILRIKEIDAASSSSKLALVLVGNKCDVDQSEREVTTAEGQRLADEFGCAFMETSAKDNINIHEVFLTIIKKIRVLDSTNGEGGKAKRERKSKKCIIF